jgi:competence protein ComEA
MIRLFVLLFLFVGSLNSWAAPVDVNTADAATIAAALHGIGLKKAQAIVADREKNGAFKTADDLARVKGIGAKTIAKNKADIMIGGAVAPATVATTPAPAPVAVPSAPVAVPAAAIPAAAAPVAAVPAMPAIEKMAKDAKSAVAVPVK